MYSNYPTSFFVKDILNSSEQQQASAHYGMDYNTYNMNSGYYGYDTSRLTDQISPMSQMPPLMMNTGNNSCLYSNNSSPQSLQPTYTNLSCSQASSMMTALSPSMQLPVSHDGLSPKHEAYENNGAPTPSSDHDDLNQGHAVGQGVLPPHPPGIDPGAGLTGNTGTIPSQVQQHQMNLSIKTEKSDELMDKRKQSSFLVISSS